VEQGELDLRVILHTLRRRLWLILLLPLGTALVAGLLSYYVLAPVYSASTTLWVVKEDASQISYNDVMLSRNLTKTYAEVARSRAVLGDAINRLQLSGLSVQQLQAKLTVTPVRDTEIIQFTVVDANPQQAAALVTAVSESFRGQIRTYMRVENVAVVDPALVPASPIKPRPLMNIAIAAVLGAMGALGLAFLLEYLDTTIKSPEDVAARLGLPVLGVIPVIDAGKVPVPSEGRSRSRRTRSAEAVMED